MIARSKSRPIPESTPGGLNGLVFSSTTETLLERAEQLCRKNSVRLTPIRRQVLGILIDGKRPAGAYELLDQLQNLHGNAAPPTVYRALDFLLEQGLIHKVERLSSFVPCTHILHQHTEHDHESDCIHTTQFLICRNCGMVTELADERILDALVVATGNAGFKMQHSTIEIEGLCSTCLKNAPHPAHDAESLQT